MKTQIIITILSALGAGAVGAIVVGSGGVGEGGPADGPLTAQVSALQSSIDSLRADNDRLMERLNGLENRPPALAPTRHDVEQPTSAEVAAIQEDLSALAAAMRDPDESLPANFRLQISNVLDDLREEEEKKRDEDRKQRDEERMEERLQEIVKELNLNVYQAEQLRTTLDESQTTMETARDEFRESRDFDDMRSSMEEIREAAKTDLARYMTPEQLETMNEKYMSGRGSVIGGFGGRRGGGGGGGGFGGRGG